MSRVDTLRAVADEWRNWFTPAEIEAIEWAASRVEYLAGTEHVGGVQWCVTHHGLNDETGENHIVTERDADGDVLEVHEDCCDSAELEPDGTFRPCDLRDLVALPKVVVE